MRAARVLTRVPKWSRGQSKEANHKEIKAPDESFYDNPATIKEVIEGLSPSAREEITAAWDAKSQENKEVPPASSQVIRLAVLAALPMIGFGFMDNAVMIVAGDYIDARLCVSCGFTTLFAAGLGNIISDVAGVATAGPIEVIARRIGVRGHGLTPAQMSHPAVITMKYVGTAFGVTIGCILGMFPLLWPAEYRLWAPRAELEKDETGQPLTEGHPDT
eukprot:TRINITY_DN5933_c4_g1_i1.p1 TRINITY_DN5933_c4_g1~~TRINITY_DN5933_c4_g1_i1.p1  ORF type:complete len:218 (+),score=30.09 TRINITY_DN5933_c4_g1_i1:85-738(+)